jgi:hypothetical protein
MPWTRLSRGLPRFCCGCACPIVNRSLQPPEPGIKPLFEPYPGIKAERLALGRGCGGCNHSHYREPSTQPNLHFPQSAAGSSLKRNQTRPATCNKRQRENLLAVCSTGRGRVVTLRGGEIHARLERSAFQGKLTTRGWESRHLRHRHSFERHLVSRGAGAWWRGEHAPPSGSPSESVWVTELGVYVLPVP